ncbi:MAG: tyrosine-type recombinase/integrase [Anaerolineae bacterium]|nr:tyrosine-type recombinase/integrase [Anaerolineae bacterium]
MAQEQDEVILTQFEESLSKSALSSSTIVNYLADLRVFLRWGRQKFGNEFSLGGANQEHIRLYRYHLTQELHRAAATVNRHLMALRKFFAFAREVGFTPANPTQGVALVQNNGQAPSRPLSEGEVEKLFKAAENGARAGLVRRDQAILQLMLQTGLRVSEVVDLQKSDLIFDNPGLRLKVGNGRDETTRYLPIRSEVCKMLNEYLAIRPQTAHTNHVFLSQKGQPVSERTVQRIISDCAKTAGLAGVSAQSLRRTFAVRLLAETGNLDLVSKRLGHQNSAITAQYLAVHDGQEN